ncbi:TolC family protein [Coprobacter tertius]|uniref:TolC family protein n=1 Tax=Coprobacter tertius TaxID=2944915 RepID=A0ABT1ME91_9BACT|nr:TolC family protein [Coprobacter tertius]MCP9610933.1 TolC family protein [Coprobacter tertius]
MNKRLFCIVILILCLPFLGNAQNGRSDVESAKAVIAKLSEIDSISVSESELFDLRDIQLPPLSVFLESVEKHPTVRVYDAKREEAEAELKVEKRKWLDYFRITGNYQYGKLFSANQVTDHDNATSYYTFNGNTNNLYNIGVSMSIPLGDLIGGQKQSVLASKARLRQMEYDYATTVENRKLVVLEAYNKVQQELAVLKAKAEAAVLYNAQMKISEQDFINGKIDIIALSMERSRRSAALVAYESGRVALQNAITLLEMLTNVKIMER